MRSLILCLVIASSCVAHAAPKKIRIGYFPNITHAPALVGLAGDRFQKAFGDRAIIESYAFNAGPSAVEALFADSLDLTFIGPNPAINAFIKSGGKVRVVAGVCSGGARLLVRKDAGIKTAKDFAGKKIATPQLGNTQDVAARAWLNSQGLSTLEKGGSVQVIPTENPNHLTLLNKKEIDASWTVEPWASRLEQEAGAVTYLDEKDLWHQGKYATTLILVSEKFLKNHPDLVQALLAEHIEIIRWINAHPDAAKAIVNAQLKEKMGKPLPDRVLNEAFRHLEFTYDPIGSSLTRSAEAAFALGYLGRKPIEIQGLVDLTDLNHVLAMKKLPELTKGGENASSAPKK